MPALNFLCRKWLIACDDFVVPCAIEAALRLIWCVTTSLLTRLKLSNCSVSVIVDYSLYGCAGYLLLTAFVSLCISLISARGSVLETKKRRLLSKVLYFRLILFLCDIAAASFGVWLVVKMDKTCTSKEVFIKVTTVFAWIYVVIVMIGMMVCYDSLGSRRFWNIEANSNSLNFFKKAQYIWRMRLKLFCCCADISEENDFIYVEISTFLASFLNGIDLVPTDILAGIISLSQKHVLERKKYMLVHLPYSIELLEKTPVPDWMTPENALHFLRIAKSTYGWMAFFSTFRPWRLCILAPQSRCCTNSYVDEGNCCGLNLAGALRISGLKPSDILHASFSRNSIHEPAFFVATDHRKRTVVLAIRGTSSFADLLTDIDAEHLPFQGGDHIFQCHRGALRSALFLQKRLSELGVLESALAEYPDYSLALTGHSLGGTVAALLALLLKPRYPHLQCYVYGPMAAVSSLGLPETLGSVLSVVVGEDMAPRLSASSCSELRKQILESLGENKTPKYKLLAGACWYHVQKYFKIQPQRKLSQIHENRLCGDDEENGLQTEDSLPAEDNKLFAPGRILYFERKNWCKPYWLTGLNLQNIIINPDMISDHQPHKIQGVLEKYIQSIQESSQL